MLIYMYMSLILVTNVSDTKEKYIFDGGKKLNIPLSVTTDSE